jgi:hypothetical protein
MKKLTFVLLLIVNIGTSFSQITKVYDFGTELFRKGYSTPLVFDNKFIYGATNQGGEYKYGQIYKVTKDWKNYTILHSFDSINGCYPQGELHLINDTLYGFTKFGGENHSGILFSVKVDGTGFQYVSMPLHSNVIKSKIINESLYCVSEGVSHYQSIFSMKLDGSNLKTVLNYDDTISSSGPDLSFIKDSFIYGVFYYGGLFNHHGYIYKMKFDGSGYTRLYECNDPISGSHPHHILNINDKIYCISDYDGQLFSINFDGSNYKSYHQFPKQSFSIGLNLLYSDSTIFSLNEFSIFTIHPDGSNLKQLQIFSYITYHDTALFNLSIVDSSFYFYANSEKNDFPTFIGRLDNTLGFHVKHDFDTTIFDKTIKEFVTDKVTIYPNPANGYMICNICSDYQFNQTYFELFNIEGRKVLSRPLLTANDRIECQGLSKGVYIARIFNCTLLKTIKVVIK